MAEVKLNLGSKIKFLREMRGLSQEAVALDIGISQQAIQQIEAGKIKVNLDRADEIARSLGTDIEGLLAFQPANYLNNCTQSGVFNTNNLMSDKLLTQIQKQNETLRMELEYLRQQNMKLLELLGKKEG